ncbi:hypothetical protein [Williamsia soli]|uniref:hypothetical protein n=1 Tax=Williamsia soli TaxID=364929 RepID=UPI001A9F507E|nr:hypothetical protein [Williamsia soli]
MTATQRYGEIADGIKFAAQADVERLKVGRLLLDLQARCAERLVDFTITGIHGVDWMVRVQSEGADPAEAIDKALDELSRCQ